MSFCKIAAVAMLTALVSPVSGAMAHDSPDHAFEAARVNTMQEATLAFLASLDVEQRAKATTSLDDNVARTSWSNLPLSMAPRAGVAIKEMTGEQRRAFHAMMAAAFSS